MHEFRLISQYYGALDAILGHTPYLSRSSGVCWIMHRVLAEMLSHVLISWGFITSLLDGIHVILRHTPYPPGLYGVCLFAHTTLIEMMSHVIFFVFTMFLLDVILGHTPYV